MTRKNSSYLVGLALRALIFYVICLASDHLAPWVDSVVVTCGHHQIIESCRWRHNKAWEVHDRRRVLYRNTEAASCPPRSSGATVRPKLHGQVARLSVACGCAEGFDAVDGMGSGPSPGCLSPRLGSAEMVFSAPVSIVWVGSRSLIRPLLGMFCFGCHVDRTDRREVVKSCDECHQALLELMRPKGGTVMESTPKNKLKLPIMKRFCLFYPRAGLATIPGRSILS